MPLDCESIIHDQAWELIEGSPAITNPSSTGYVRPGNRLNRQNPLKPTQWLTQTAAADFPRFFVNVSEGNAAGAPTPRTFGMNNPGSVITSKVDYPVFCTFNLTIEIIHDFTILDNQTPVEAAIRGALLVKGPTMGISWVRNVRWQGVSRRDEKFGDTQRTRSVLRWVVDAYPKLSLLIEGSYYL